MFFYARNTSWQEKERLERKAAKVEKEKKEKDAQSKSRSIMANFFAKPKASTSSRAPSNEVELAIAGPSQVQSEFSKSFKPFVLKKDATLAPINWFLKHGKKRRRHVSSAHANEVITIDCDDGDEEIDMQDCQSTKGQADLGTMSARGWCPDFIKHFPSKAWKQIVSIPFLLLCLLLRNPLGISREETVSSRLTIPLLYETSFRNCQRLRLLATMPL